jgi:hypothetical protein
MRWWSPQADHRPRHPRIALQASLKPAGLTLSEALAEATLPTSLGNLDGIPVALGNREVAQTTWRSERYWVPTFSTKLSKSAISGWTPILGYSLPDRVVDDKFGTQSPGKKIDPCGH